VLEGPVPLNVVVEELVASHRHLFECSRQVCWTTLTYLTGSLTLERSDMPTETVM
jgi:hypothetical protein